MGGCESGQDLGCETLRGRMENASLVNVLKCSFWKGQKSEKETKVRETSCVEQNDLGLSLGLDAVSSACVCVCVHSVWVHREIWLEQCVLLFSWPPHCVYLSVVKMPYAKWVCVTALVTSRTVGPTHSNVSQKGPLNQIQAYKVDLH